MSGYIGKLGSRQTGGGIDSEEIAQKSAQEAHTETHKKAYKDSHKHNKSGPGKMAFLEPRKNRRWQ